MRKAGRMRDLISRQAAIDALKGLEFCHYMEFGEYIGEDTREVRLIRAEKAQDALQNLPSAEPEIIRCKDCRHGVDYYHEGDCYCSNPKWGLTYFSGSWEFYCADAERRTDETN